MEVHRPDHPDPRKRRWGKRVAWTLTFSVLALGCAFTLHIQPSFYWILSQACCRSEFVIDSSNQGRDGSTGPVQARSLYARAGVFHKDLARTAMDTVKPALHTLAPLLPGDELDSFNAATDELSALALWEAGKANGAIRNPWTVNCLAARAANLLAGVNPVGKHWMPALRDSSGLGFSRISPETFAFVAGAMCAHASGKAAHEGDAEELLAVYAILAPAPYIGAVGDAIKAMSKPRQLTRQQREAFVVILEHAAGLTRNLHSVARLLHGDPLTDGALLTREQKIEVYSLVRTLDEMLSYHIQKSSTAAGIESDVTLSIPTWG